MRAVQMKTQFEKLVNAYNLIEVTATHWILHTGYDNHNKGKTLRSKRMTGSRTNILWHMEGRTLFVCVE